MSLERYEKELDELKEVLLDIELQFKAIERMFDEMEESKLRREKL